jgi:hypothetical protein
VDALKAWRQLAPDPELVDVLVAAVHVHARSPQWRKHDGAYIPYPGTWIRGRRWEDELTVVFPGSHETAPTDWLAECRDVQRLVQPLGTHGN